ncbi:hypothetical protein RA210_U30390 [Rubrivivax sp. A210]|nr:hypothetical protein RA210_U30390 [Rubrivivax sp. A210]
MPGFRRRDLRRAAVVGVEAGIEPEGRAHVGRIGLERAPVGAPSLEPAIRCRRIAHDPPRVLSPLTSVTARALSCLPRTGDRVCHFTPPAGSDAPSLQSRALSKAAPHAQKDAHRAYRLRRHRLRHLQFGRGLAGR